MLTRLKLSSKDKNYYLNRIKFILIQKYDLYITEILDEEVLLSNKKVFDKIIIDMQANFSIEQNGLLKNNLIFLEMIAGQKALGFGEFKYIGSIKKFFFKAKISLRKKKLINFLYFFISCCLATYYKRNGIFLGTLNKNSYELKVIDFNIFPNFIFIPVSGMLIIKFFLNLKVNNNKVKINDILKLLKI